jgi:hypothetical protein
MIGSVSSGFRRRRRRNASRAAVAATARPAGSRQLPPADPGDVRGIPARRESTISRSDRCARIACPSKPPRAEPRARRNFTLASGVAATTIARERARTSAGFAGVSDSGAATSGATRELSGRSVVAWLLAIVGSIAASSGGDTAGLSAVLRSELPFGSLAGDGPAVAVGVASRVGTATTAGSAAGDGAGASREGSMVSGSTYPCGSLVTRVPK